MASGEWRGGGICDKIEKTVREEVEIFEIGSSLRPPSGKAGQRIFHAGGPGVYFK